MGKTTVLTPAGGTPGQEKFHYPEGWGNDQLDGLVEVPAPDGISWYPQTAGWDILGMLILLLGFYLLAGRFRRYLANAYRRGALAELECIRSAGDYQRVPRLLKRTALYAYPRDQVSHLVGADWEQWLDRHCANTRFSTRLRGQLNSLAYRDDAQLTAPELAELCRQVQLWIRHHQADHA